MSRQSRVYIQIFIILLLVATLSSAWGSVPAAVAQADPVAEMLERINADRQARGLVPYAINEALMAAAERHSQDMAVSGKVDHTGSDQSSYRERILAAGYGQWTFGPMVNESVYAGTGGTDIAYEWWMSSDAQRTLILSPRYREIGIAQVVGENGWTYWTLAYGAQPNVLPAFINDGATEVDDIEVRVTLTNENAVPAGEGMETMGQALQVRVAHDEQFTGAEWQPWQPQLPFRLLPQEEPQRVYVQYRDAQGRTAVTSTTVKLTEVPPTASPTAQPSDTPTPLASDTPPPSSTPTPGPTSTLPSPTSPPTSTTLSLTLPPSSPAADLTATQAATRVSVTSTPLPATRTRRPRPSPRPLATPTAYYISLNSGSLPSDLAITWIILQTLAIVLGLVLLIRRPSSRRH